MFNILLLLILLHYVGFFMRKKKEIVLTCGIFGWTGGDVSTFNKNKFNILGLANEERGTDSCGIGSNGKITVGTDDTRRYSAWIKENYHDDEIFKLGKIKSIIGHTRKASHGTVNMDNAHPFGFGRYNDVHAFIGVHNGTIYNKNELAIKHGVSLTKIGEEDKKIDKIDSEILLEAIYLNGDFKVLEEYNGGAAIAFINTKTPTRLYLFKGSSQKYTRGEVEERPLYVFKENKNSLYFSSLKTPLYFIGGKDDTIIDIKPNIVYEIQNGDFSKAKRFKVDRIKASQTKEHNTYTVPMTPAHKRHSQYNAFKDAYYNRGNDFSDQYGYMGYEDIPDEEPLEYEKPVKSKKEFVKIPNGYLDFRDNLRFYTGYNHLAAGVYMHFPGKGFKLLSLNYEFAVKEMEKKLGKFYIDGAFRDTVEEDDVDRAFVPFPKLSKNEDIEKYLYYFHKGILLRTKLDWNTFKVLFTAGITSEKMSHMSVYPVKDEIQLDKGENSKLVYYNGCKFKGKIKAAGSNKIIFCAKGRIKRIHPSRNGLIKEYGATHFPASYYNQNISTIEAARAGGSAITVNTMTKKQSDNVPNPQVIKLKTPLLGNEEKNNLKKFNTMARNKANESVSAAIINLDNLIEEMKIYKENDDIKIVMDTFEKLESTLYDTLEKLSK